MSRSRPYGAAAAALPDACKRHFERDFAFARPVGTGGEPGFSGSSPTRQLVVEADGRTRLWSHGRERRVETDPVDAVARFIASGERDPQSRPGWLAPDTLLPRTVGYLSYELGARIEGVAPAGPDPAGLPLAVLSTYDEITVQDGSSGRTAQVRFGGEPGKEDAAPVPADFVALRPSMPRPRPLSDPRAYRNGFDRIKRAIADGEIYQANLTRRLSFDAPRDPLALWLRMSALQPVEHAMYLAVGEAAILGNSPECFLRIRGDRVLTRPIKGTRPADEETTARARAAELAADEKEGAEHLMIVDLERNDLGRVCEYGSVRVQALMRPESFATVHHLTSDVAGTLRHDVDFADVLRATFPGGSITGAPKVRAMQILSEVESEARGVYTGAVGYANGARASDWNVSIRTAVVAGGMLHYRTGGGIVADSKYERELEETMTKSRVLVEAMARDEPAQRTLAS